MTSLRSRQGRIAICSVSTWATGASHVTPERGALGWPSTRSTQGLDHRLFPDQQASVQQLPKGCVVVSHYSKHWPCLLPQHGPGKKHLRPIRLDQWQEVLVKEATEEFVRGLIDSDGCRVVANDRGVKSVRYHFSNRSDDIRALFCAALDDLGIPWTRPRWFEVAVYRKAAVARLDEFVGPKA